MRIRELAVLSLVLCAGGAVSHSAHAGEAPSDRFWLGFDGDDFALGIWVAFDGKGGVFPVPVPDSLSTAWFDLDAIPTRLQSGPYTVTLTQPQDAFNLAVVDNVTLSGPGSLTLDNSAFIYPDQGGPTSGPTTLTLDTTLAISGAMIVGQPSFNGDLSTLRLLPGANLSVGAFMRITRFGSADLQTGLSGYVINSGRLAVDDDFISSITINGDFEQTRTTVNGNETIPGGTLVMDVFSPSFHDTLGVTGAADLGGTLVVRQLTSKFRGFIFSPGDRVEDIIGAPFVFGSFDAVFLPALENARFRVEYPDAKAPINQAVSLVVEELPPQPDLGDGSNGAVAVNGRPVQAVTADLNGDGFPDLAGAVPAEVLARGIGGPIGGGVVVVLNRGVDNTGAWLGFAPAVTYLTGLGPVGIASGDVDQDGDIDLAVVNPGNPDFPAGLRVLLNNGDGTFEDFGVSQPYADAGTDPRGVALGDFIPDALNSLDAAVTSRDGNGQGQVVIFQGLQAPPSARAWGGFNPAQNIPLGNTNPGTVQPGGLDNPKEIDDLVVGGQFGIPGGSVTIFFNNDGTGPGDNFFRPPQQVGTGDGPANITVQDIDNDGDSDIVTSNSVGGSVSLILNEGIENDLGVFNAQTLPAGADAGPLAVLDIDGDTDNDIAVVTQSRDNPEERVIQVLRNDTPVGNVGGPLSFAEGQTFGAAAGPLVILPGDADQDGDADLLAFTDPPAQPTQQATAFLNVLCPTDLNGSGGTDMADLVRFLGDFGRTVEPGAPGDFNVDGSINTLDLVEVIGVFGTPCN
jgi:hypothetical protein